MNLLALASARPRIGSGGGGCDARAAGSLPAWLTSLIVACTMMFTAGLSPLIAQEIQIERALLEVTEEGPAVSADFRFDLPTRLEGALNSGVPLHFIVECEVSRSRWYWLDERVLSQRIQYRLSYHALTRQYRLAVGALHQNFASLAEAMAVLTNMRSWLIGDASVLRPDTAYDAWLRIRLDSAQLPKPFQAAAFGNRDFNLASSWRRWRFTIPAEREVK